MIPTILLAYGGPNPCNETPPTSKVLRSGERELVFELLNCSKYLTQVDPFVNVFSHLYQG